MGDGLGADPVDSDTTYASAPHAVNVNLRVYIGGAQAQILYQGSAGYPGVNIINVVIPQGVATGCWVSVAAVVNDVSSNVATLPISPSGGECLNPVSGFRGSQLAPA